MIPLKKLNPQIKDANSIMAGASIKIRDDAPQKKTQTKGLAVEKGNSRASKAYSAKDIAVGGAVAGAAWKLGGDAYGMAKKGGKQAIRKGAHVAKQVPGKVTNVAKKVSNKAKGMIHSMQTTGKKVASYASKTYRKAVEFGKHLASKAKVAVKKGAGNLSKVGQGAITNG